MAATIFNIILEPGADWDASFVLKQDDNPDPVLATPLDVTGYTAKMQVRSQIGDTTALVTISETLSASGQITVGTTNGLFSLNIKGSALAALAAPADAFYDVLVTSPTGKPIRALQGEVKISPRVTV